MPLKSEPDLFLSVSLDCTVRIWSLDKFQQIYIFSFSQSGLNFLRVYDDGNRVLFASGSQIIVNQVHLILKNYLVVDSNINNMLPGFDTVDNL